MGCREKKTSSHNNLIRSTKYRDPTENCMKMDVDPATTPRDCQVSQPASRVFAFSSLVNEFMSLILIKIEGGGGEHVDLNSR